MYAINPKQPEYYEMIMKAQWSAIVFSLYLLAQPAAAGQLANAISAFNHGNSKTAIKLLKPLAEQGNPGAQYYLGLAYEKSFGVPHDHALAMTWFEKSAY